jgi:RNA polymerase sigma factor (sigma-70 family)
MVLTMSERDAGNKPQADLTIFGRCPWYRSACRHLSIRSDARNRSRMEHQALSRPSTKEEFEQFMAVAEPRLRVALVAVYGPDRGREAAAEALAYAWEHWERLRSFENIPGYLYRVGRSAARPRGSRPAAPLFSPAEQTEPWFEPGLADALSSLTDRQRTAVVLVHGFGWTLREVAEVAGLRVTSVQNHLERGMAKLRSALEVSGARSR